MKIAIASEGKMVSEHFGHCEGFTVYDVEDDKILKQEFIKNPGHRPGFLPKFLGENSVNVIISGGMGGSAQSLFKENNIDVVVGARGSCEDTLIGYLSGKLESSGSICHEHAHHDECGSH